MDIVNKPNDELLKQTFTEEQQLSNRLNECKLIASTYAQIENSIAVPSDMKTNTSHIYYGGYETVYEGWSSDQDGISDTQGVFVAAAGRGNIARIDKCAGSNLRQNSN